jgi:hypothetical protein
LRPVLTTSAIQSPPTNQGGASDHHRRGCGKEDTVSLTNVWLRTLDDELIRADQIVGIHTHYTPALVGKPACWLLDVLLLTPLGHGRPDGRTPSALHRTLIHTPQPPTDAPTTLARLLAQLDAIHATGVITTTTIITADPTTGDSDTITAPDTADMQAATPAPLRFRFTPFAALGLGHHTGPEYL